MKSQSSLIWSAALLAAGILPGCVSSPEKTSEVVAPLPVDEVMPGWRATGDPKEFSPDTIYDHINGEAEIYYPYGLRRALTNTYSDGKDSIVADVYEMGSLLDAFGIFSNYRSARSRPLDMGAEGFVDDYQIMFYKDRFFVRITVVGDPDSSAEALRTCAARIDKNLPGHDRRPVELNSLDVSGVKAASVRYIAESVLGYPFFPRGFVAECDHDGRTVRVFVIQTDGDDASAEAMEQYADFLSKAGATAARDGDVLTADDPMYRGVYLRRKGRVIVGAVNLDSPLSGKGLVAELAAAASATWHDL